MDYYNEIRNILQNLPHRFNVSFALHCAKDAYKNFPSSEALKSIDLVERWLNYEDVTNKELTGSIISISASDYAFYASYNAACAASEAASSIHYVLNAIRIVNSSYSSNYRKRKLKEYCEYLLNEIDKMSNIEKMIYGIKT